MPSHRRILGNGADAQHRIGISHAIAPQLVTKRGLFDAPAQDTIILTAAFTGISNLRRLAVSNFAPWSCYSFPGLTHLALFRIASRDMGRRLLDMLAACLHLEVIYIAHIYPKDEGFEPGFDDRSRVKYISAMPPLLPSGIPPLRRLA